MIRLSLPQWTALFWGLHLFSNTQGQTLGAVTARQDASTIVISVADLQNSTLEDLQFFYSTDAGKHWTEISKDCLTFEGEKARWDVLNCLGVNAFASSEVQFKVLEKYGRSFSSRINGHYANGDFRSHISWVTNLDAHPFGGVYVLGKIARDFGFYADVRPTINLANHDAVFYAPVSSNPIERDEELWSSVYNVGVGFRFPFWFDLIGYFGGGVRACRTYDKYSTPWGGYDEYVWNGGRRFTKNFNAGIALQTYNDFAVQFGFDSAAGGVYFGFGACL